jgi:hypothetical protein
VSADAFFELRNRLDAEHVDPTSYSLDGGTWEDRYHIDHQLDRWEVYFVERGQRVDSRSYATKNAAEAAFLRRVLEDPTTRRPAG